MRDNSLKKAGLLTLLAEALRMKVERICRPDSCDCIAVFKGVCLLLIAGLVSAQKQTQSTEVLADDAPLIVQQKSDYITDRSRWGKLIFNPSQIQSSGGTQQDVNALVILIEKYHRAWLSRDTKAVAALLHPNIARFRNSGPQFGVADVIERFARESRGERPEGYAGSTELAVRDLQLRIHGEAATALYRIDTHVGARWEYSDMQTVLQAFKKTNGVWALFHHVESNRLDDQSAPLLPAKEPNRRAPFVLDFVYPVKKLSRAIAFYTPFLGPPETVTPQRASFRLLDSKFELEAQPFDSRISIIAGAGNGYGIINVPDLTKVRDKLLTAGAKKVAAPKPCGPDLCLIAEDPSHNIVVWRQRQAVFSKQLAKPVLSLSELAREGVTIELEQLLNVWILADRPAVVQHLAADAIWVDDTLAEHPLAVAVGSEAIGDALNARWNKLDRGPDGIRADMEITELKSRAFGTGQLISFEVVLRARGAHPMLEHTFVSQFWRPIEGLNKLQFSFSSRKFMSFNRPVSSLDYTAYPLLDLGKAGRFYKTVLGTEPYRDSNWFGFWSVNSVFGMFEAPSKTTSFRPYPHRNNGYADLTIRSAEEVLALLKASGAKLPIVPGINNQAGIDPNPGYRQILAIDTEGNLINFSEYGEY